MLDPLGAQDTTIVSDRTEVGPDLPSDDDEGALRRGSRVGRYLVLGELGRGGMGVVHRAYDPELDRPLALKRLRRSVTPDPSAHARLRREAQTLARLSDPHVVTIYDVGQDEDGLFIAMELVTGEDLAAWLRRGPHPWPEVVERFAAAGRGLAAAHRVGVVHRDFKPANVLLGADGRVVVTDFGLARSAVEAATPSETETDAEPTAPEPAPNEPAPNEPEPSEVEESRLTKAGVQMGTPAYMAPEQHVGASVDARADQYAFCVALFEALFGQRPFPAYTVAELSRLKRDGQVQWPTDERTQPRPIPARLRRLLTRGLDPHPERRFSTMDELLARLDPTPRRRGWAAAAVPLLAVVAIAGVARSGTTEDPCAASDLALGSAWSDEVREAARQGLAAVEQPYAAHTAESTVAGLDAWAERFVATHREVCEATWIRAEQSSRALDARMGCLDDRRLALQATAHELAAASVITVENAEAMVMGLPDPEACATQPPAPEGAPERSGASSGIRTQLAELDAMRRAGRGREALPLAETLAREVGAGLDPDTGASLQLLLGILRDDAGDFGGARHALEESARLARSHGDARDEAEAWIELTRVVGTHLHDADDGRFYGELALATIAAAGDDAEARARARLELGEVAFRSGDLDAAARHWEAAEALHTEQFGAHDLRVAQVRARMAGVDFERGRLEAARSSLEQVVARYRERLGPEHPRVAAPLGNLGLVLSALGDHEAAAERMKEAIAIAMHSRGVHHPQVAGGHDALGQVLATAGRIDEAAAEFEAAIDGFERSLGPEHPALVPPLTGLGRAWLDQGRAGEAVAPLERALALADTADLPPVQIADARLALARALPPSESPRADRLAREAIEIYEEALPPDDERWSEVRAWRERQRQPPE